MKCCPHFKEELKIGEVFSCFLFFVLWFYGFMVFVFLNSTRHLKPDQNITEFGGELLLENGLFAASLV